MRALGTMGRVALGPRRLRERGAEEEWLEGMVFCEMEEYFSSAASLSSSTPKDSFPRTTGLGFFFGGRGAEILRFDH